jgi:hypothetical protein
MVNQEDFDFESFKNKPCLIFIQAKAQQVQKEYLLL